MLTAGVHSSLRKTKKASRPGLGPLMSANWVWQVPGTSQWCRSKVSMWRVTFMCVPTWDAPLVTLRLMTARIMWPTGTQMARHVGHAGITNTPLCTPPRSAQKVPVAACELSNSRVRRHRCRHPRRTLGHAGLRTSRCEGPWTEWSLTGGRAGCATGPVMAVTRPITEEEEEWRINNEGITAHMLLQQQRRF